MKSFPDIRTTAAYTSGVQQTLRRVLDILSFFAAVGVLMVVARIKQVDEIYALAGGVLLVLCVLPSVALRKDRHLAVRGLMTITGILLSIAVGLLQLGLNSVGLFMVPFLLAFAATLFNRMIVAVLYLVTLVILAATATAFVTGLLNAPEVSLADWSRSPTSWLIVVLEILMVSFLLSMLMHRLSGLWKRSDSEAERKAQQFETIIETAPDAIAIVDVATRQAIMANQRAAELFGLSRDDFVMGPRVEDLSPEFQPGGEPSIDLAAKYIGKALAGEHPTFQWVHVDINGKEIPCEVSLSRMPSSDDRTLIRSSTFDVRERLAAQKRHDNLQEQLAASQRLETIGKLTGGMAHDFNNLLAVTLGNLELLKDDTTDEKQLDLIDAAIASTLRGADLTKSMLAYARRARLAPKVIDLNKIALDVKSWVGRTLPKSMEIETSLLAGLWPVCVDPNTLESALLNLMLNARDAMDGRGNLTIETANVRIDAEYVDTRGEDLEPGRYVMLAISDTGHGISEETLVQIFEPFFTTKEIGQGSGLGLSMVLGFMKQSGGTVRVYSEVGVGTTFKLYFSVADTGATDAGKARIGTITPNVAACRILVAEDEVEVCNTIVRTLERAGHSVTAVHSGDAAYATFEADPTFDLLVTDIVMPGTLQGTDLSRALRAQWPELQIVFMSGYASEATVHGNGLRAEDIRLMKPVQRSDLLSAIHNALNAPTRPQS